VVDVSDDLVRSSTGLAGGGGETRGMCGAVIAGMQALGLRYGRIDRDVDRQPALTQSARLVNDFKERFGTVACGELLGVFPDLASRARKEHCASIVAFVAERVAAALATPDAGR